MCLKFSPPSVPSPYRDERRHFVAHETSKWPPSPARAPCGELVTKLLLSISPPSEIDDSRGNKTSLSQSPLPLHSLRWPQTPFSALRASWGCWDNILTDAKLIKYSTYHKTNLSDTELTGELIRYELTIQRTYLILSYYTLNLLVTDWFDTELIRYWTFKILNLSDILKLSNTDIELIRYWAFQIVNLSDAKSFLHSCGWYWSIINRNHHNAYYEYLLVI
jgi:hypothetical protein